jgi:hypothetical protein
LYDDLDLDFGNAISARVCSDNLAGMVEGGERERVRLGVDDVQEEA